MRAWLASLAPRERLVLGVGVVAALVIVLWSFVWRPLASGTSELESEVATKRELVADLQRAAALAPSGGGATPAPGASRALFVLVDETAQAAGLAGSFTATRPDGRNNINVSFQSAPFDSMVDWLLELERAYGIRVESASFSEAGSRGLVSGQVQLSRS